MTRPDTPAGGAAEKRPRPSCAVSSIVVTTLGWAFLLLPRSLGPEHMMLGVALWLTLLAAGTLALLLAVVALVRSEPPRWVLSAFALSLSPVLVLALD